MRYLPLLLTTLICSQAMAADETPTPPAPVPPAIVGSAPRLPSMPPSQTNESTRRIAELEDMVRKQNQLIRLQTQKINELQQGRQP